VRQSYRRSSNCPHCCESQLLKDFLHRFATFYGGCLPITAKLVELGLEVITVRVAPRVNAYWGTCGAIFRARSTAAELAWSAERLSTAT